jgi:hypothetical protein
MRLFSGLSHFPWELLVSLSPSCKAGTHYAKGPRRPETGHTAAVRRWCRAEQCEFRSQRSSELKPILITVGEGSAWVLLWAGRIFPTLHNEPTQGAEASAELSLTVANVR